MTYDTNAAPCSCRDYQTSRRTVLKGMGVIAGAAAFSSVAEGVFRQIAYADGITNGHVLVVLSLHGGADGLSMVVPYGDTAYATARPRTAVPASALLATDGYFGLHPSLAPLEPMWQSGKMAAVHAVGLPQPNRSHFDALKRLELADPGST